MLTDFSCWVEGPYMMEVKGHWESQEVKCWKRGCMHEFWFLHLAWECPILNRSICCFWFRSKFSWGHEGPGRSWKACVNRICQERRLWHILYWICCSVPLWVEPLWVMEEIKVILGYENSNAESLVHTSSQEQNCDECCIRHVGTTFNLFNKYSVVWKEKISLKISRQKTTEQSGEWKKLKDNVLESKSQENLYASVYFYKCVPLLYLKHKPCCLCWEEKVL